MQAEVIHNTYVLQNTQHTTHNTLHYTHHAQHIICRTTQTTHTTHTTLHHAHHIHHTTQTTYTHHTLNPHDTIPHTSPHPPHHCPQLAPCRFLEYGTQFPSLTGSKGTNWVTGSMVAPGSRVALAALNGRRNRILINCI